MLDPTAWGVGLFAILNEAGELVGKLSIGGLATAFAANGSTEMAEDPSGNAVGVRRVRGRAPGRPPWILA